jgi:hypothetical protein
VVRFSADRTQLRPGDGGALLSWQVDVPAQCARMVQLNLNGSVVSRTASRRVNPVQDIAYSLAARGADMTRTLGRVQIIVDTSGCDDSEISEETIIPQIQASVNSSINDYNNNPDTDNKVTKRRETQVEVEPSGIVIRLRLKLDINNFWDPDVDVDARIAVSISAEGGVVAFYRSFSVDVDWPWWVTGITLGITKIVEEFIDEEVKGKIKSKIVNDFRNNVQAVVSAGDRRVVALATAQDRIIVTSCPRS